MGKRRRASIAAELGLASATLPLPQRRQARRGTSGVVRQKPAEIGSSIRPPAVRPVVKGTSRWMRSCSTRESLVIGLAADDGWLAGFHAGEREALAECYRNHYPRILSRLAKILTKADAETVAHETFYRVVSDATLRASFEESNFGAWLSKVAQNAAIDHWRRSRREQPEGQGRPRQEEEARALAKRSQDEAEAKWLVERFRREHLPPRWEAVFEARFLRQLPQREAAKALGMHRTTLVYQEIRIRALLERFLLRATP